MNSNKFQNKYRIKSVRLSEYDYASDGYYFVTISTYKKEHWFGEVVDGRVVLNDVGVIVDEIWRILSDKFKFIKIG